MSTEATNPAEASTHETRRLNRGVMEMISALTTRLTSLHRSHKPDGSSQLDHGMSIITLAGNNAGATMRSDLDQKGVNQQSAPLPPGVQENVAPPEWATLVNSNFQAANNSIMLETEYESHDPGVHVEILDAPEPKGYKHHRHGKRKGNGKSKDGTTSSLGSDPHSSEAHSSSTCFSCSPLSRSAFWLSMFLEDFTLHCSDCKSSFSISRTSIL